LNLQELINGIEYIASGGKLDLEVEMITEDTRQIKAKALFVAVPGFKTDGHKFIQTALQNGAVAVVIENEEYRSNQYPWIQVKNCRKILADLSSAFYGHPSRKMNIVGVTGTNGKTTTTNLIAKVLENAQHRVGLIGTIHNRIGEEIIPVEHTTPGAPELQRTLRYFAEQGADYAVMEVSSHALDLHRVDQTEYDIAVFTNLTQDHLDYHENMENYLAAKGKLFSRLGQNSFKKRRKFAILNADDPASDLLADRTMAPVIKYGVKNDADVKAEKVRVLPEGVEFYLKYTDQELPIKLKLAGLFNVYNALAAIAVGLVEGIPAEQIIAVLEEVPGIPGRFENVQSGGNGDYTVIVDYSHTPDSLENCLKTARTFARGRVIAVFGCGGDRDRTKRPLMGEIAGRQADVCIVTSDNPRSENPESIIDEIMPGLEKTIGGKQYFRLADRKEAIFKAIQEAKPEDVVIIAGKGHEDYQIIGSEVIHFDDREVALDALRQTGKLNKSK
jgi:UDP-N-acetylmuramoyl-L-alanyl-D-glutamate--2,6-diaminopimelate ligase